MLAAFCAAAHATWLIPWLCQSVQHSESPLPPPSILFAVVVVVAGSRSVRQKVLMALSKPKITHKIIAAATAKAAAAAATM